jgi:uncharacterized coiled-coil protein SlyX
MNTPTPNEDPSGDAAAIVALEEQLTFQQRQLDDLNAVIVNQQAEIKQLRREMSRLIETIGGVLERGSEDLPHERPPHY